ncbi:hypothetical protein Bca4012_061367 [Brassica carinata]
MMDFTSERRNGPSCQACCWRLENETYESLVEMVRSKYRLLPSEPLALTYDFPDWMKIPGDYTTPPVDIVEDGDVELFMAVRMDFVNLTMCVTFGYEDFGRYGDMQRLEFGLTEEGKDVVPPKPIPWRGFPAGGFLQISEAKLMTICSNAQMGEIRRHAVRLTRQEIHQPLTDVEGIHSETDSSDEMDVFTADGEGVIRLQEGLTNPPSPGNLTLAIAAKEPVEGVAEASSRKGKGIATEAETGCGDFFRLNMGLSSGFAGEGGHIQDPDIEDVDLEILGKRLFSG